MVYRFVGVHFIHNQNAHSQTKKKKKTELGSFHSQLILRYTPAIIRDDDDDADDNDSQFDGKQNRLKEKTTKERRTGEKLCIENHAFTQWNFVR